VLRHLQRSAAICKEAPFREALAIGEEAVRIAEAGDPQHSLVGACAGLGSVCVLKGEVERAASILERGLGVDPGEPIGRGPSSPLAWERPGWASGGWPTPCPFLSRQWSGRPP
jgi:hypothetical protein